MIGPKARELKLNPREDRIITFALRDQRHIKSQLAPHLEEKRPQKLSQIQMKILEIKAGLKQPKELQVLTLPFVYPDRGQNKDL